MAQLHPRTELSQESIFARMSRLAAEHGAINLGQGFPSNPPPPFLLEAARRAIGTVDQYTPPAGLPRLREAVAEDLGVSPQEVIITAGGTEALHALAEALYGPGDEVVMLEPYFDVYIPQTRMAGATPVMVPMRLTDRWEVDFPALEGAITPRTKALLLTNPYNPTGSLLSKAEAEQIVALARQHDLWIVSDEVYDELYFNEPPIPLRRLAPERVFTVGSAGKRLEATGWRIGWIVTPPGLAPQVAGMRQWSSFCSAAPLQAAVAEALPIARKEGFYAQLRESYARRKDLLEQGLRALGLKTFSPAGTYFLTALLPGLEAEALVREAGVAAIPGSAFYTQHPAPKGLFRFAFCKTEAEIEEALRRLAGYLKVRT
ncbi:MAG: aminotransferase class I/II-fold pyridoxal phosphate-dependent enzyme [Meiothermus sp.]|uniref:pyridoxal phosphate-dependent aminotransferase n=2 Tax=Meiothermus sp. TaxID=1955249 RepID=UPI0025E5DC35|nr:aminotransferase class I/II-fold pyridoxal phosphate-dependent enzyme [Meiothermus sp.]MCS7193491.1 aminotransferase class I/II-fold pyridoxal phosphate-dependent enzyme [Meiothermus sp.]MCX7741503.1 aminotransferase class I/II-fold pyridoxal phosphate-dependent enzyme [Meiothermus sp.]MDW8090111.1 aminotransferase class I/II-fold pyridoxal phosphate-dependent enzyme [Meiothermus sp.]MDW8481415.1 aminotransferase class I/II-fold pyridoxal phosphate-dependent enzyme [Meiothermus sp.]